MALTAEQQASRDHWREVHLRGDASKPIWLPDTRRVRTRGVGRIRGAGALAEELV